MNKREYESRCPACGTPATLSVVGSFDPVGELWTCENKGCPTHWLVQAHHLVSATQPGVVPPTSTVTPAVTREEDEAFAAMAPKEVARALDVQEGGNHYKTMTIQPFEYIHANGIPFAEGNVIKYVSRWRTKGGLEDLKKARHFLDLLIQAEDGK